MDTAIKSRKKGTEQHQFTLECQKTTQQVCVGPSGMYTMPYRESYVVNLAKQIY